MAVAVPLLIGSTAAGAAAATAIGSALGIGLTAGGLATAVGVVFQVTGVNDKINKAASKVFGEDLVNVANIFGTVYSAATGSWDLSDEAGSLFGGGAEAATSALDAASFEPLTEASWNAAGADNLSAITEAASGVAPASDSAFSMADTFSDRFGDATGPAVTETNGYSLTEGSKASNSIGADTKTNAFKDSTQTPKVEQVSTPEPTSPTSAASPGATAPKATGAQTVSTAATQAADVPKPGSFFGDLMKRLDTKAKDATMLDKMIAGTLASVPQAYSASKAQDMAERKYQDELARSKYRPTVRTRF